MDLLLSCEVWWRISRMGNEICCYISGKGNPPITDWVFSQRPVTRSFDILFDVRLNKRLSKQSRYRWLGTQLHSLWRHCNVRLWTGSKLVRVITWRQMVIRINAHLLSIGPMRTNFSEIESKQKHFIKNGYKMSSRLIELSRIGEKQNERKWVCFRNTHRFTIGVWRITKSKLFITMTQISNT